MASKADAKLTGKTKAPEAKTTPDTAAEAATKEGAATPKAAAAPKSAKPPKPSSKGLAVTDMSDKDVLSMPTKDYMNDVQLAFFRHKLVSMREGMLASAGATTEHLREENVVVPDPTDRATIEEEHALELRTRDRERKLLKKIEQSIARIDAGDYGYCDETGEPIGLGRLIARPTANLSIEAQERREQRQKLYGD